MSESRASRVPAAAVAYFGPVALYRGGHPLVEQVFRPGQGWRRHPLRKRVSGSEVRRLRADGVTVVALRSGSRLADFDIRELVR